MTTIFVILNTLLVRHFPLFGTHLLKVLNIGVTINNRANRIMRNRDHNDFSANISNHHVSYRTTPATSASSTSALQIGTFLRERRVRHYTRILNISIQ